MFFPIKDYVLKTVNLAFFAPPPPILLGIFLLMLWSFSLKSQGTCSPFELTITKVVPTSPWRINSSASAPGAYHAYYSVKLKTKNGGPLPASWTLNSFAITGKMVTNKLSSRINKELTQQVSPSQYLQYLDIPALDNGEVNWIINGGKACEGGGNTVTLNFPQPSSSQVTLFTIVVDAAAGDQVQFTDRSNSLYDCVTYFCNDTELDVKIQDNNSTLTMPAPPVCSTSPSATNLSYNYINKQVLITLNNVLASQPIAKFDAVLHIVPNISGFTNDFDIVPSDVPPLQGGVVMNKFKEKRKNADGSYDVYFAFENFSGPASSSFPVLVLNLTGFNSSQGGTLTIGLTTARISKGATSGNPPTCSLASTPPTVVNVPGWQVCNNNFKIDWSNTVNTQDCNSTVTFTISHTAGTPIAVTNAKFLLVFAPIGDNTSIVPGTISTTLPNGSTYGTFSYNSVLERWEYLYEFNGPGSISIQNGAQIVIPFSFNAGCLKYGPEFAEVKLVGAADRCALSSPNGAKDLCNPKINGSVVVYETQTSFLKAPQYIVKLQSINQPSYILDILDACQDQYSFCPDDPTKAPFRIIVNTNPSFLNNNHCTCGVSTYDALLIAKHLNSSPSLSAPYAWIAGNTDRTLQGNGQQITIEDADEIRNCIRGSQTNFGSNSAPSWWYISDQFVFTGSNPLINNNGYETSNIVNVPTNGANNYGNFWAVKTGDVNQSCKCEGQRPENEPEVMNGFMVTPQQVRREGKKVFVPVWSNAPFELVAAQAGFRFDPSMYKLTEIHTNPELPLRKADDFGLFQVDQGEIRFVWFPMNGESTLPRNAPLFTLEFEVKQSESSSNFPMLWISDNVLQSVVYDEGGREMPVQLDWKVDRHIEQPLNVIATPNPFVNNLNVLVFSPIAGKGKITLSDLQGRVQSQLEIDLNEGENFFEIQAENNVIPGVYMLSVESEGQFVRKKVLKL